MWTRGMPLVGISAFFIALVRGIDTSLRERKRERQVYPTAQVRATELWVLEGRGCSPVLRRWRALRRCTESFNVGRKSVERGWGAATAWAVFHGISIICVKVAAKLASLLSAQSGSFYWNRLVFCLHGLDLQDVRNVHSWMSRKGSVPATDLLVWCIRAEALLWGIKFVTLAIRGRRMRVKLKSQVHCHWL